MKNIKTFNPVLLARNAIGACFLMTILNMILIVFNIMPIFPLSLIVPTSIVSVITHIPADVMDILTSELLVTLYKVIWGALALVLVGLLAYSYWRSNKKAKAIKIGYVVIILDTIMVLLNFSFNINFLIEVAYHAFLIYYVFKGVKALKTTTV